MSLKKKLIFLLLVTGIILALFFSLGYRFFIAPSLGEQKKLFIDKVKRRIVVALSIEEEDLSQTTNDWTDWESFIQFLKHPTKEFERNALPDAMFTDRMLDLVVLMNQDREIVLFRSYQPEKGFISKSGMKLEPELRMVDRMMRQENNIVKGILNSSYGPIMFVASPVIDRINLNRREGILVMGRFLDENMLKRFSSYTTEKIRTLAFNNHQLLSFYLKQMHGRDVHFAEKGDIITVFQLLKDIKGTPAVLLYTETDNRLFQVLTRNTLQFVLITSFLVVLLGLMFYFSIDKYIVKRILHISNRMSRIEGFSDLSTRVESDRMKDEVSHLISSINLTLDRLDQEKVSREHAEKIMIQHGKLASIGRLTSSIAHEINNPLLAISNSVQVIKKLTYRRGGKNKELLAEALDISESEIHRIRDIISGLLDFHRLDKEEFAYVNLKNTMLQSLSILKWSKKLGDVEIIQHLEDECYVVGASVRLKQVFINFILNAVEAILSKSGGKEDGRLRLMVRCSVDGRFAEVHFIDNGPGLPPKVRSMLFEPFVSTKGDKGVGLGLYVSYKIIETHHGEIIYNEEYTGGTHFILKLPLDKEYTVPPSRLE